MAGKSIIGAHVEISSNSSKFVNEFAKADAASKKHNASIRNEVDNTIGAIAKKFSSAKFAMGFLKGLGIGGGLGLVHTLYEKISDVWNEAANNAKEFSEYLEKSLETSRKLHSQRIDQAVASRPVGEGIRILENELKILEERKWSAGWAHERALADLGSLSKSGPMLFGGSVFDPTHGRYGNFVLPSTVGERASNAEMTSAAELDRLSALEYDLRKKITELTQGKAKEAFVKAGEAWAKIWEPPDSWESEYKRLVSLADQMKDKMPTPWERYVQGARDISTLHHRGFIDEATARKNRTLLEQQYRKDTNPLSTALYRRFESTSRDLFGSADEMQKRGMGLGGSYRNRAMNVEKILGNIADMIRQALHNGWNPNYAD